jgi:dihydroneopterin aldolase
MTDHIYLHGMVFEGRHGVTEEERAQPQPIEVDVDLALDLRGPGASDELADTVDYGDVFDLSRRLVEERSFRLLEGIAEALAREILLAFPAIESVKVRTKKPGIPLAGIVEHAGVEIERRRAST